MTAGGRSPGAHRITGRLYCSSSLFKLSPGSANTYSFTVMFTRAYFPLCEYTYI
jgi:hypothetical protein